MYYAFSHDFMNQWNDPKQVENERKKKEDIKHTNILRMNIEILEKCLKKNMIDSVDRTKQHDNTFICDHFFAKSGESYLYDTNEMIEFTNNIESKIKELGINYCDNDKKNEILKKDLMCSQEYKFFSNVIPKNTFTNIDNFLVFRISNVTENITENITKNVTENILPLQCLTYLRTFPCVDVNK